MKNSHLQFTTKWMFAFVFFISYILVAYYRGNHLLGGRAGAMYVVVAVLVTMLFLGTLSRTPVSRVQVFLLVAFAVPVSLAFAFPTYLNSDLQYFVSQEVTARNARGELSRLFAADQAFDDLVVSTTHLKIVNVEIRGSVPTKSDLERLRSRILHECDFVEHCIVHWHVHVRDESKTYTALGDGDFTPTSE